MSGDLMAILARDWNGHVFGTNTGKLNLEFTEQDAGLQATLRFMDDATGLVQFQLQGNVSDTGHIELNSTAVVGQEGVEYGELHIEGDLSPDNTIRGNWRTIIGTGGSFILHPFINPTLTGTPQQIITKRVYLGFIQIYREDIVRIAQQIRKDFSVGKIIVTYLHEGTEGSTWYDDFIERTDLRRLGYLKLAVSEPEGNGFNRMLNMEFRSHGLNEIMIQGTQEAWVTGRAVMMENFMKEFSDIIRDTFVKFAGPIQVLLFIGFILIVSGGDMLLVDKLKWAAGTFAVVQILPWAVQRLFPRAIIVMGEGKTHWFKRLVLRGGTWLIGGLAYIIGTVATKYGDQIATKAELLITTFLASF
jgi:hypothetical protein